MRRFLLLFAVLIGFSSVCFANPPRRGYRGFYGWDFSIGEANSGDEDTGPVTRKTQFFFGFLDTTHGYQFNSHIFAGAGFMLSVANFTDNAMFPIYADFRYDNSFGKYNLFFDMRGGTNANQGIYLSPTIGYRFPIGKKMGFNLGFGLTIAREWHKSYTYDLDNYQYLPDEDCEGYPKIDYLGKVYNTNKLFTIRFGIDF